MNTLFDSQRMNMADAIELTVASLNAYGPKHEHWAIAYSGGKDSSTLLTLVMHVLKLGRVQRPQSLTVCYADTRLELTPLAITAGLILDQNRREGVDVRVAMAALDKRFMVYILGRGVPPPNNNTLRWCTRQIKVDPMQSELKRLFDQLGNKLLMLTGVRLGESAARDSRIALSCGKNGAECGQGWYQESLNPNHCTTLAPILHWRACLVWDWLIHGDLSDHEKAAANETREQLRDRLRRNVARGPSHGYPTQLVAEAYGQDADGSALEINARTGCMGCPLVNEDTAIDRLIQRQEWRYLEPLKGLRPLWRELRLPEHRLRKPGGEARKDGTLVDNQHRLGPIKLEVRRMALDRVLSIQNQVNAAARAGGRPAVDILNAEEHSRIVELIEAGTWPQRWNGDEPSGDEPFDEADPEQEVLWPTVNGASPTASA